VAQLPYTSVPLLNGFPVEVVIEPLGMPTGMEHEKDFLIKVRSDPDEWHERVKVKFFLEAVPRR